MDIRQPTYMSLTGNPFSRPSILVKAYATPPMNNIEWEKRPIQENARTDSKRPFIALQTSAQLSRRLRPKFWPFVGLKLRPQLEVSLKASGS